MENLKLLRKVKKINQQKTQRELRESTAASSVCRRLDFDDEIESLTNEDHFEKLSDELMIKIFEWIPRRILLRYAQVSKRWNFLIMHESLWKQYDLSNKTVKAEILIKLLNKGVKIFGLGRSNIRKSLKKSLNQTSSINLATQLDSYLHSQLKIECLDLTNAVIETKSINALLKHTKNLRKISLESLDVDYETFNYLSFNSNLNTLNVCLTRGLSVDCFIQILNSFKSLKNLNIAWTNLERESVVLLCKHLPPRLRKLNLSGCKTTLLDSDIKNLVTSCPCLTELDVSDAQSLTNLSIQNIGANLKFVEYLAFSRCYSITPSSYFLLKDQNHLVSLDLFNILNDKSFEILKTNIPSLLHLNRYMFSSIGRPIPSYTVSSVWSQRLAEITLIENRKLGK